MISHSSNDRFSIDPDKPVSAPAESSVASEGSGALQPNAVVPPAMAPLTPEEQMALYEADLKENDWGHRPC